MSSNLLFIPYRKTLQVNLGAQLRDVISREYFQTSTVFEADIQESDTLRNDIIDLGVTTQDLALLKRYYIHLTTFESKFPYDIIEFPWYGTLGYNVTGPVKIKSFFFERVNILYNIASLYTQLAVDQDRTNDDGLKKACLYFQYAATHFKFILELSEKNEQVTLPLDLQKGTIETLYYLSLAQAQEVFWQKAFSDQVKDSLIARLAIQVSDYYSKASESINRSEGFRSEWIHHISVKQSHFKAAAEYRASLSAVASSNYGEEVARLKLALKSIQSVSSKFNFVNTTVLNDLKGLEKTVTETLQRAEKDNDLIYLQEVPSTVTPILKASVMKELNIDDVRSPLESIKTGNYGKLLFKDLLPYYVIQAAEAFRERQSDYVDKHIISPIKSLSIILEKYIAERGLPGSLDAIDKPQSLPSRLTERHNEIKAQGGVRKVKEALDDIQKLSLDAESLIEGAKDRLALEAKEDELLRSRQGSTHWTRPKSDIAAVTLYQRTKELENYLKQAKDGDSTVRSQFLKIEPYVEILGSSESKIKDFIPNSKVRDLDPSLRRVINELREALAEKRKLEYERNGLIENAEIKSSQYNILPKIVSEYKNIQSSFKDLKITSSTFEPVFDEHIKNFARDIEAVDKQNKKQRTLENKIDELNRKFTHLNDSQGSSSTREKSLKILDNAYLEFEQLIENLSQGLKFYNDFNVNAQSLVEDIDDFVYNRRIEARDLEADLNSKFRQLNLDSDVNSQRTSSRPTSVSREGSQSPALIAPRAQSVRSKVWRPEDGIRFD